MIAYAHAGRWRPTIRYIKVPDESHEVFLQNVAYYAQRFFIAPNEETAKRHLVEQEVSRPMIEPADLGFMMGREARDIELLIFDVLAVLMTPSQKEREVVSVDLEITKPLPRFTPRLLKASPPLGSDEKGSDYWIDITGASE